MKKKNLLCLLILLIALFSCNRAEKKIEEGKVKLESGDYPGAILLFNEAKEIDSSNADVYYYLGIAKNKSNDFSNALADLNKAIDLNKDLTDAYYQRAVAKFRLFNYTAALEDINVVIKSKPDSVDYLMLRGTVYTYLGKKTEAKDDFTNVITIDPENVDAYLCRAKLQYALFEDNNAAIADCDKVIAIDPENFHAYIAKGFCDMEMDNMSDCEKDFLNAIVILDKKIKANPKSSELYGYRGYIKFALYNSVSYKRYQDYNSESMTDFSKGLELDSANAFIYFSRGSCKMYLDDYSGAIEDYIEATENNLQYIPEMIDRYFAYQKIGICEYRKNNFKNAVDYFTKIIDGENRLKDHAYDFRGQCKIELKDNSSACEDFTKAGELGNPEGYEHIKEFGCK